MQGSPATVRCVEEMVVLCRRISDYAIDLGNQTAQFSDLLEELVGLTTGGQMTPLLLCVKFNLIGNQ